MSRMTISQLNRLADDATRSAGVPTDGPRYTPGRIIIGRAYGGCRVERVSNESGGIDALSGYGTMRQAAAVLTELIDPDAARYKIVRMYRDDSPSRTIRRGLTLEQARAHCSDPETSSSTCTSAAGRRHTRKRGPWFDGYSLDH